MKAQHPAWNEDLNALFRKSSKGNIVMVMGVKQIEDQIANYRDVSNRDANAISNVLEASKLQAINEIDEPQAKWIWTLENILLVQNEYHRSFELLKTGQYYEAWCELEKAEITLNSLEPHLSIETDRFGLCEIKDKVLKLQSLFPYKIFMSPEILILEEKCSICGAIITPRKQCEHKVGEIYAGAFCFRLVTKMQPIGMSFVEKPVQKYSVPFLHDEKTNQKVDQYDYSLLKYLMTKIHAPFEKWRYEISERLLPHSKFFALGRNDRCPCGSGEKYKKCCLLREGVKQTHYEFILQED
jgi:hypothetical protein